MNHDRARRADAVLALRRQRFERLYGEYHAPVFGYVLRRTDCPDDAADVIAETFLIVWRRLEDIPPGEETRLWLYGVARRVLANQRRGQHRRSTLADRLSAELAVTHHEPAETAAMEQLAAAFQRLPNIDREVLALEGWEGLDAGQIALVLGCSRNAARIRLHRARRRLAALLAHTEPGCQTPAGKVLHGEAT